MAERGRLKKEKENKTPILERKQQKKTTISGATPTKEHKKPAEEEKNEARFHLNKKKIGTLTKKKKADEEHNVDITHPRTTLLKSATLTNFLSKTKVSLLHGCSAVGD